MLITILATIGLFVIIIGAYKRGKKDGINQTIDFFVTEIKRKKINIEVINDFDSIVKKSKFEIPEKIRCLLGGENNGHKS